MADPFWTVKTFYINSSGNITNSEGAYHYSSIEK